MDEQLNNLINLAKVMGVEGVWLLRDTQDAQLNFKLKNMQHFDHRRINASTTISTSFTVDMAGAALYVVMRFPTGDGGKAGLEVR